MKRFLTFCMMTAVGVLATQSISETTVGDDTQTAEVSRTDGERGPRGENGNRKGQKGERGQRGERGQKGERQKQRGQRPSPEAMLEKFDSNGDQMLSQDELPKQLQKRMEKLDADNDGQVSVDELTAAMKNFAQGRRQRGEKRQRGDMENDKKGKGEKGKGKKGGQRDPAKLIEKLDTNDDGMLSVDELPEKLQARMGKMDTNGDGQIELFEIEAMAAMKGNKGKSDRKRRGERDNMPVVPEMPSEDFLP